MHPKLAIPTFSSHKTYCYSLINYSKNLAKCCWGENYILSESVDKRPDWLLPLSFCIISVKSTDYSKMQNSSLWEKGWDGGPSHWEAGLFSDNQNPFCFGISKVAFVKTWGNRIFLLLLLLLLLKSICIAVPKKWISR